MTLKERIRSLAKSKSISLPLLEEPLGFGAGTISKWDKSMPSADKLKAVAQFFGVSMDYLMTGEKEDSDDQRYYLNEETAQIAQDIFDNKELRLLFSAARDSSPEDLKTTHEMLMALKRKEKGVDD